ncbi:sugar transferase [Altibacter sp. HG106]|uniref:sugar transferase n=1 Tax=Altibacter sp. HG106 TaxID=3023937 RepID=UPI0023504463|nr:sugar transferase [Altibacter sp. HG106]MDC7995727.1 sugar transferase [Altibacter sp. HG106]
MLSAKQQRSKRRFDVLLALLLLPCALLPILLLLFIATLSTGQWGWFVQERIGQYGKRFKLYKIRSLKGTEHPDPISMKNSETRFGRWLRKTKLDELPQLFNILKGDMSWVGPRPDLPGYADTLTGADREILQLKPGLTGPATVKYKDEEAILLQQADPQHYNDTVLWPDKVKINLAYGQNWSFKKDLYYIWRSF